MQNKFYPLTIIVAVVLTFVAGFLFFKFFNISENKTFQNENKQQPLVLTAEPIYPTNTVLTQQYVGYVTPIHEVSVTPYIDGFIEKVYIKGGELVNKGDVLLILKQDEYIAMLENAKADIVKAQAVLQNAANYFERLKKAGNAISASDLEAAEAQYLSALASLEQAKANYTQAQVNYNYTVIHAPISGIVGDVSLTQGNYVSPTSGPLFTIVQYNPIRVVFSISDKQYLKELSKTKPFIDETLLLELPNGDIFKNKGVFRYTDNSINKQTGSMAVYADFQNIGKILTPNTYVTVLSKNILKNSVSVAKNLVILENNGNFIYLIRNGILRKEQVEILGTNGETFVLKNTFEKGDAVVTEKVNEQNIGMPAEILQNSEHA
ncbi:MAG: efflux RND transporter periplasmic adaptor subunit [Alphaproteobacteria bacterium]|nr:efflux RND transporter periplasmic adaptor subunit [Alphaproteobacteria bacterium]